MPIEETMGIRHIDNISHIGGLIYTDMQKTIVVMYTVYTILHPHTEKGAVVIGAL